MKKLVVMFTLLCFPSVAFSFPFRAVEPGKEIPTVELKEVDGTGFSLSPATVKGKGLILLFWGADSDGKKKRSMEVMEILNEVTEGYQEIGVLAINEGDKPEVVKGIISQIEPHYSVLLDERLEAYKAFGVFLAPSILVVNGQGQVKTGFGYSNTVRDRVEAEVLVLLGKISEQNAKERLVLEVSEKSEQERKAMMHLELGKRMENRGMPDKAKEEYQQAVKLFDLAEAHIRLGVVLVEEDDLEGAEGEIKKGLALDPDLLDAKIAYARLRLAKGDQEGIMEELQALLLKSPNNHALHYALGNAHEAKGELNDAAKEYRKTIELLSSKPLK